MNTISHLINLILHLDKSLYVLIGQIHNYVYLLIFLVIFCETGLVVTPFLPGDSLLFIAGGIAATQILNIKILAFIIVGAAFLGDNVNFLIGKFIGDHLFKNPSSKIFRKSLLDQAHQFYEKHGSTTIIIARFVPLMRTFVPFVAGLGHMSYLRFISSSIVGTVLWSALLLGGGYLFSNLPFVKGHLSLIMLAIVVISLIPAAKIIICDVYGQKSRSK